MLRPAVAQVVAIDARDDDVLEPERRDRLREVQRLLRIRRQRPAVRNVAKRAAPRAEVSQDHESGRAFAEALADVGARRFLADGVQLLVSQDLLDFLEALAVSQ